MADLIREVTLNYLNVLSNTIPDMLSGASPAVRLGAYCATALLYPLALVVLMCLVGVAWVAVSIVRPFIEGET
ncbi:MAG: hypothetical protein OXF42_02900 [Candidatus Dadabacteria bacterium]|nr:hypothetical protein [Candidatus Dadabacteria bacterium]